MRATQAYRGDKVLVDDTKKAEVLDYHVCTDRIKVRFEDGLEEWVYASRAELCK